MTTRITSTGRKFALVEGLSHDLESVPDRQVWHGQLSPRFGFNKLKSLSGGEIDQNHVDKRILGGRGRKTQQAWHNFCPASV